jgi:hypothetical protein
MSAYAIPGALFLPPLDGYSFTNKKETGTIANTSLDGDTSSASPLHESIRVDIWQQVDSDDDKFPRAVSFNNKENSQEATKCRSQEVEIVVKQAKLDPVLLVQSLSRSTIPTKNIHHYTVTTTAAQHEEAIQFELSIEYNGRNYTATRTFRRIVQLRNDLIQEINTRRKQLQQRRRRRRQQRDSRVEKTMPGKILDGDDVSVPELPDCENHSHHNRGFTMLQALLRNYCPIVERWLRRVADLFPQSESLGEFLWEPIGEPTVIIKEVVSLKRNVSKSFSSLQSIPEGDDDDEEDDGSLSEDSLF